MSCTTYFSPQPHADELPSAFISPFDHQPHPLAQRAAQALQAKLAKQAQALTDGGKMFGVLVVRDAQQQIGFLSAFAGQLAGQWQLPGFVPPVFDAAQRSQLEDAIGVQMAVTKRQLSELQNSRMRQQLQQQLQAVTSQQQSEYRRLAALLQQRKTQRQQQRAAIKHQAQAQQQQVLNELAHASQQDKRQRQQLQQSWQARLAEVEQQLQHYDDESKRLTSILQTQQAKLHQAMLSSYKLTNMLGEEHTLAQLSQHQSLPQGSGDCVAPKLLQYALRHGLTPLAIAEFWWGESAGDDLRHHAHFYPACRSKCQPILPFMLKGLAVKTPAWQLPQASDEALQTVYEDEDLLLVNKPHGLLSVPGKEIKDSVQHRLQQTYAGRGDVRLLHRLDRATSGLLLAAKNAEIHRLLQQQFIQRCIEKRYVAILSKRLSNKEMAGRIDMPLRVDLEDRPRQRVCYQHGKAAITHWQVLERQGDTTRVYFYPLTGRTHQLRVHAAHRLGLNAAIVGDELYGRPDARLLLHAEQLCFTHPRTGERLQINAPPPF